MASLIDIWIKRKIKKGSGGEGVKKTEAVNTIEAGAYKLTPAQQAKLDSLLAEDARKAAEAQKAKPAGEYARAAANKDEAGAMAEIDQEINRRRLFAALGGQEPSPLYSKGKKKKK